MKAFVQKVLALAIVLAAGAFGSAPGRTVRAANGSLTLAAFGGTTQDNVNKVFLGPFARVRGIKVYNDTVDYGKLYSMVDAHHVTWDLANTDGWFANKACNDGHATPLAPVVLNAIRATGLPRNDWGRCWVAAWSWSGVLAYSAHLNPSPKSWADFYNPQKFPGKRSLASFLDVGQFETALNAAGRAPNRVYPIDLNLAVRELNRIKGHILFSDSLETQVQQIVTGQASMGLVTSARAQAAIQAREPIQMSWQNQFLSSDPYMVPKGAPDTQLAMQFLAYMLNTQRLIRFAKLNGYGPNTAAARRVLKSYRVCNTINTCYTHLPGAIGVNWAWWTVHQPQAQTAWSKWAGTGHS